MSWIRKKSTPELEDRLRSAAESGNLKEVKKCLAQNVNVNAQQHDGWTALHFASHFWHLEVVQCLVQEGKADVNIQNNDGWTALHKASDKGLSEMVQFLVQEGKADVNIQNNNGWTALHLASFEGHLEVVQYLVREGKADVNIQTNDGWTALHWACQKGHLEMVQYLVRDGKANVNAKANDGPKAKYLASQSGYVEVVHGNADANVKPNARNTALHFASEEGHLEVVQYLVRDGNANVAERNYVGSTALHRASQNGHLPVVQYLVRDGKANVEAKQKDELTALHYASESGHLDVVQYLVRDGKANVEAKGKYEKTALHLASRYGHVDVVQYLVRDGKANVEAKEKDEWTALHLASDKGHLKVVEYLVRDCKAYVEARQKDEWTALHLASQNRHLDVVQYLVRDGKANVEAKGKYEKTALHWASQYGHEAVVQYLVRDGKANVEAKQNDEWTALHYASRRGHVDVVQYLVRDGKGNVEAKEKDECTALHLASGMGHLEVVQYLVRDGKANVEARQKDEWTALHLASQYGHLEVVKYLVRDGRANFEAVTNGNESALDVARRKRRENVVKFLSDCIQNTAIPMTNPVASPSTETPMQQPVAATKASVSNEVNDDKEIVTSRDELQRMLNEPAADPTSWSINYLEECTDNFTSKVLGEGGFGKVYFGCDKVLGAQFAVKRLPTTSLDPDTLKAIVDSVRREVLVLKKFRHPNIVVLYGFNLSMGKEYQFLVYEYLVNGALSGFLMDDRGRTRLPAHVRISIMFQVARAVHFLHTGGCDNLITFHRDIKSGNICLTQGFIAKLIDCGMSELAPKDKNVPHGKSVAPSLLKPSGSTRFGTAAYTCPHCKLSENVSYTSACDVYSIGIVLAELVVGCLQVGQSTRNEQEFGDFLFRYRSDKTQDNAENWQILKDADPLADWNMQSLKALCKLALKCMSLSPEDRPTTVELVQQLGRISKADFQDEAGIVDDGPLPVVNTPTLSNENDDRYLCAFCNESVVETVTCSSMHATCIPCLEQYIQDNIGRSGDGVGCGIIGCNVPFKDDALYGKISSFTFKEYMRERERQASIDNILKVLISNHADVMTSLKEIRSLTQRSLKGLAYMATESVKKCPTLVWIIPAEPIAGRSTSDWVNFAKNSTSHRRYHVYFVCQHSFSAFDLEPKMEIEVPKSWMVQAAPVLRLSLFAIKTALSALGTLPFPIPEILPKERISMMEQLVSSFLNNNTTKLLATFESACTNGIDLPHIESAQLMALTGPAYEGIVEKATKLKRTHWKQHMVPVMNHHGSLIWVKKEYQDLY